jgi:L,D-transpeptidase catalytic domain
LNTDRARYGTAPRHQVNRAVLANVGVLILGVALAMGSSPAAAKFKVKHKYSRKQTEVIKQPFGDIPKGPLQIFISINQQKLHLYSDGTHVADAPVATGVPSHPTPMGVFSVIEKQRYHRSNIYSNAPMPYMQRITWSGVAMHEGPGVGHVASHGCIRMPHDFAARLWVLTRLGVRVIIARPELRPTEFADPHLFVHKEEPSAPTAALPEPVKTAQTVDSSTTTDAANSPVRHGLVDLPRTSDSAADPAPVGTEAAPASTRAQSTDATSVPAKPAALAAGLIEERKDVTAGNAPGRDNPPTAAAAAAAAAANVTPAPDGAVASETVKLDPARDAPKREAPTTAEVNEPAPVATAQAAESAMPAEPANAAVTESTVRSKSAEPAIATSPAPTEPGKPDVAESGTAPSTSAEPTPAEQTEAQKAPAPTADAAAPVTAAPEDVPMPLPKPARLTRAASGGPIAIFVSRKAGKIYVRQHFAPLFEARITIAHREQPLGTHVFTAMDYLNDGTSFRWTVVSLPGEQAKAARNSKYEKKYENHGRRGRRREAEVRLIANPPPPETPQEALARIEIPQDVIDQISQLIVPGSSLVVSDQDLGPETGDGTDFIVISR